jgi:hypothetical protein
MGFLSNLFGKKQALEPVDFDKTAELMDEDKFWQIVHDSLERSGGDQESQVAILVKTLEGLSPKETVGFRLRTDKLLHDTYTSDMWCAGYIMNGGCSDDMFEYFRLWVISQGREVYENAKANPDSLIAVAEVEVPEDLFAFESFWYVALTAFKNKTGKELYDHIDYDNFKFSESKYPQFDFTWTEGDDKSREKICPQLFERFEES